MSANLKQNNVLKNHESILDSVETWLSGEPKNHQEQNREFEEFLKEANLHEVVELTILFDAKNLHDFSFFHFSINIHDELYEREVLFTSSVQKWIDLWNSFPASRRMTLSPDFAKKTVVRFSNDMRPHGQKIILKFLHLS